MLETETFENLNISDEEDDQSSGNVTYRVSDGRTGTVPVISSKEQQGLPRWDTRWPIDVWVSCGEPFVPLEGMFWACSLVRNLIRNHKCIISNSSKLLLNFVKELVIVHRGN